MTTPTPNMDELLDQFRSHFSRPLFDEPAMTTILEMVFLLGANMTLERLAAERSEGGEPAAHLAANVLGVESAIGISRRKVEALRIIANQRKD